MLILSRKLGEEIAIGESIKITVTKLDRGQVRLGIDAPRDVHIRRHELPTEQPSRKTERSDRAGWDSRAGRNDFILRSRGR